MLQNAGICTFWLTNVLRATAAWNFWTSDLQKVVRTCGVLHIETYKCAWRYSGVRFLDIWPSKIGPRLWCFCIRATAACHFLTSERPKVLQPCGVLYIWTWKCASRHSGVPFLDIWPSKIGPTVNFKNCSDRVVFCAFWLENVLRATAPCHFSSVCWTATSAPAALARLLFEHQEPRIIGKTQRFATSLTFGARVASFYWLYLCLIFILVTLLVCWSSFCWLDCSTLLFNCPYCRKLDF